LKAPYFGMTCGTSSSVTYSSFSPTHPLSPRFFSPRVEIPRPPQPPRPQPARAPSAPSVLELRRIRRGGAAPAASISSPGATVGGAQPQRRDLPGVRRWEVPGRGDDACGGGGGLTRRQWRSLRSRNPPPTTSSSSAASSTSYRRRSRQAAHPPPPPPPRWDPTAPVVDGLEKVPPVLLSSSTIRFPSLVGPVPKSSTAELRPG
jgi:hypothetical protein